MRVFLIEEEKVMEKLAMGMEGSAGAEQEPAKRCRKAAHELEIAVRGSAPGSLIWLPNGMRLRKALMEFSLRLHEERGYQEVKSPSAVDGELFERSGHQEKYADLIFKVGSEEKLALRPMSCPNHILAWEARRRSWRELPLALFEFGEVFRNEPSGSLQEFFRMRQFCQDDAHVFCAEGQIAEVVGGFLEMAKRAYPALGLSVKRIGLSLRPEKRLGDDRMWDRAEAALRGACEAAGLAFEELPGEGAFYGPKVEVGVEDGLGRVWQMGVAQLDFALPGRFGLEFAGPEGAEVPVMVHHALLGSIERVAGVLLEAFGEKLPWELHPIPAVVAPVSEKFAFEAQAAAAALARRMKGARADASNAPVGKKLALAKKAGCPFFFVVGAKEKALSEELGVPVASLEGVPVEVGAWADRLARRLG